MTTATTATTTTAARTLSRADLSRLLGVGPRTVWRYVQQGKIPKPRVLSRRKWLWDAQTVADFLRQGNAGNAARKR
jgi:excisionase family DNA binding protein